MPVGSCSPILANHSSICGSSSRHSSTSTDVTASRSAGAMSSPVTSRAPGRGHVPDRRLDRRRGALDPFDRPLQHPDVLAEARPQEPAVLVPAEPVHVEDPRQLGRVRALAHRDPVPEVVAGVVADERQHRHRVPAHDADGAGRRRGRLGRQRGAEEDPVLPVARLGHERDRRPAAAAEEDRGDRHPARVLPLRRDDRALPGRRAEARVRVRGRLLRRRASSRGPSSRSGEPAAARSSPPTRCRRHRSGRRW